LQPIFFLELNTHLLFDLKTDLISNPLLDPLSFPLQLLTMSLSHELVFSLYGLKLALVLFGHLLKPLL
jgi:hypothetical protein